MTIPERMTMVQLRDFTTRNEIYYYHVFNSKGRVIIYADRYHYKKLGETFVTDYKPIKNFKSMKSGSNYRVLQIIRKRIKKQNYGYRVNVVKPEEIEVIKNWLEAKI